MNVTQSSELPIARQFTILVYPFRHALSGKDRAARLEKLNDRWRPWWSRLDKAALQIALDDTYFFLPHVRELFFPETTHLPAADAPQQERDATWVTRLSLKELASKVSQDAVLRLTYQPERLKALQSQRLEFPRENFSASFKLAWVDVALFPQNIGFLMVNVELEEQALTVGRLNDFLYYLRVILPPRIGWDLASWKRPASSSPLCNSRDVVDFFLQGLTSVKPEKLVPTLDEFLPTLGATAAPARYTATRDGQVYGQVFHLYTYACFADSQAPVEENIPQGDQGTADLFASPAQKALYELATCTDTGDADYVPHRSYLNRLWQQGLVAFWDNWQALALHDNVVFMGMKDEGFPKKALPHNLESDYFHLYLFTLFQKTRLSHMFGELIRRDTDLNLNLQATRQLWDDFMMFQNQYWYSEVTRKPLAMELYRKFQQGLEVVPLYEEMAEQVRELQQHYERKFERRVSRLLTLLSVFTFIGVPAGALASLFGGALIKNASWWDFVITSIGVYGVVGLSLFLFWNYLKKDRSDEEHTN